MRGLSLCLGVILAVSLGACTAIGACVGGGGSTDADAERDASGGFRGTVFVDANANGVRDEGESGRAGVRVTNGLAVQVTRDDGAYAFDDTADGFVRITRPDDFECAGWYRREPGDFALVPNRTPDDFFFIQITDLHAYSNARDFARYSLADAPDWIPSRIGAYGMLWAMWSYYDDVSHDDIAAAFAEALRPWRDPTGLSNSQVLLAYMEEFERPGSVLGDVVAPQRLALAEVASLGPAFVLSTGDQVLEGNTARGEAAEPWFTLYDELSTEVGVPFFDTIGNNEIVSSRLDDVAETDPRYGKRLFEKFRGPTTFSFDRGPFHFVAIDTHLEIPRKGELPDWDNENLGVRVRDWLDADLAAHTDRVLVALNHEPFHSLRGWSFYDPVDDQDLFAKHRVPYSIAGHIHLNGIEKIGETTHITTGALSGMRWVVPASLHSRGYRLFLARERRLYSVWKRIGEPVVAFVHPATDPSAFATGEPPPATNGGTAIVAVAADTLGPFRTVELSHAGKPLPFERWGEYFLYAELPAGADASALELRGVRQDGSAVSARTGSDPH